MIHLMADWDPKSVRDAVNRFMAVNHLRALPWAKKAGISEGTIRNFLNGDTDSLKLSTLEKLAGAADVDLMTLLSGGSRRPLSPEQEEAIEIATKLKPADLRQWLRWGAAMAAQDPSDSRPDDSSNGDSGPPSRSFPQAS